MSVRRCGRACWNTASCVFSASRREESTQGPPRKYYGITEKGRAQLAEMDAAWQEMVESIDALKK